MISTRRSKNKIVSATARQLEEQLLYHKNGSGNFDISITDYWDRVVCKKTPAYSYYRFSEGHRRVVCPFHDDIKPSLGIVIDKETGVEVFNCFGCGVKGTVVHFHRLYMSKFGSLSHDDGVQVYSSLAKIYGVPLRFQVEEVFSDKPLVDFSKEPPYTVKMHKDNVVSLRRAFLSGGVSLNGLAEGLDALTARVLKAKSS